MTELRNIFITDKLSGSHATVDSNNQLYVTLNSSIDSDKNLKTVPYVYDFNNNYQSVDIKMENGSLKNLSTGDKLTHSLLGLIIDQLKIMNIHLSLLSEEEVSERDI